MFVSKYCILISNIIVILVSKLAHFASFVNFTPPPSSLLYHSVTHESTDIESNVIN